MTTEVKNPQTAELTPQQIDELRAAMRETYFGGQSAALFETPSGRRALDEHTHTRYLDCVGMIVPWVGRHLDLRASSVVEIGCGTGSSTAAFAQACRQVTGYDIDAASISAARRRMSILGLTNVALDVASPTELLTRVRRQHADGVDAVLCYAVLEHETVPERIETITTCWNLLKPGGIFVVADTPNRLTYTDHHTSLLPFFHALPADLAVAYAARSPRLDFVAAMSAVQRVSLHTAAGVLRSLISFFESPTTTRLTLSRSARAGSTVLVERTKFRGSRSLVRQRMCPVCGVAAEQLTRWGQGVSYHEFELALGDVGPLVVGDGFDPEILRIKPVTIEEELLYTYIVERKLPIPPGFVRQSLDLILRKPDPRSATPPPARDLSDRIRPLRRA